MPDTRKPATSPLTIDYFNDFPLMLQGAESIHVYEICNNLQALGNRVRLFSPVTSARLRPNFSFIGVWTPPFLKSVFYQLFVIPKLIRHWAKVRPDAIYLRVSPILLLPALLAKLYKIPIFPEINGTIHLELEKAHTRLGRILLFLHISDTVERVTYKQASRIFTVTDSLKEYLVARFRLDAKKIIVVENGVDSDALKPTIQKKESGKITIGYVGGLMWWQGLTFLIEALSSPSLKTVPLELVIVGDGPERAALEQQVQQAGLGKRVEFRGKLDHAHMNAVINSFDVCVAYYVKARDGLNSPFKVYEYLACGRPTIVSDIRGIGDTFRNAAMVVSAEDSAALAEAIKQLSQDGKLRESLGAKGRRFILDGHTWKETATKLQQEIRQAI